MKYGGMALYDCHSLSRQQLHGRLSNTLEHNLESFLRAARIPNEGYNPATFPDSPWHRVTLQVYVNMDPVTGIRSYVAIGDFWAPAEWTLECIQEALLRQYNTSFLLRSHEAVSHRLAAQAPGLMSSTHESPPGTWPRSSAT